MIRPQMSGFCRFPATSDPEGSHARCTGGNNARPSREFQGCSCLCHYPTENGEFECGNCGGDLRVAPHWPNEDEPGEPVYVHLVNGEVTGEECS